MFVIFIISLVLYFFIYRPLNLNWGSSGEDIRRRMAGDEIVRNPHFNATRTITIKGKPEDIWPWLVQIGSTRAGWYSYDLIDNLARVSAEKILPEFQRLKPGDLIPMSPDGKKGTWVKDLQPGRWLIKWDKKGDGTWVWGLYPEDEMHTKLVSRIRMNFDWKFPEILLVPVFDLGDFVMMRQCMLNMKDRAEGRKIKSIYFQSAEILSWLFIFTGFVWTLIRLIFWKNFYIPLIMVVVTASLTLLLVMLKPPVWVDVLAVVIIFAGLWKTRKWKK